MNSTDSDEVKKLNEHIVTLLKAGSSAKREIEELKLHIQKQEDELRREKERSENKGVVQTKGAMPKFPFNIVDLTHEMHDKTPGWWGDCGFKLSIHLDYKDCEGPDVFRVNKLDLFASMGTHMDSPSHCIPGGKFIHNIEVGELCMPCSVIDISKEIHERLTLTPDHVKAFEKQHGPIQSDSCVIVNTGWSQFSDQPKYKNEYVFPSVSIQAAEILFERGVKILGIDTLSPDRPEDGFKVHRLFLGAGRLLLENVTNLGSMPPVGTYIMPLPMKIREGTEAPLRLVGLLPHA